VSPLHADCHAEALLPIVIRLWATLATLIIGSWLPIRLHFRELTRTPKACVEFSFSRRIQ
jgi:hypothetical protein